MYYLPIKSEEKGAAMWCLSFVWHKPDGKVFLLRGSTQEFDQYSDCVRLPDGTILLLNIDCDHRAEASLPPENYQINGTVWSTMLILKKGQSVVYFRTSWERMLPVINAAVKAGRKLGLMDNFVGENSSIDCSCSK